MFRLAYAYSVRAYVLANNTLNSASNDSLHLLGNAIPQLKQVEAAADQEHQDLQSELEVRVRVRVRVELGLGLEVRVRVENLQGELELTLSSVSTRY